MDISSGALFESKLTGSFSAEAGVLSVSSFVLAASGIEEAGAVLVSFLFWLSLLPGFQSYLLSLLSVFP